MSWCLFRPLWFKAARQTVTEMWFILRLEQGGRASLAKYAIQIDGLEVWRQTSSTKTEELLPPVWQSDLLKFHQQQHPNQNSASWYQYVSSLTFKFRAISSKEELSVAPVCSSSNMKMSTFYQTAAPTLTQSLFSNAHGCKHLLHFSIRANTITVFNVAYTMTRSLFLLQHPH